MPSIIICEGTFETRLSQAEKLLEGSQIRRLEGKKGKIKMEQIKELLPHLYIKPAGVEKSGVLIIEAHQMGVEAQNALLKTLEEPPIFLTFVLTTPNPKLMLPTIVSRCMVIKAGRVELEENKLVMRLIKGAPGERLELYEEEVGYSADAALTFLDDVELVLSKQLENPASSSLLTKLWETKKLLRDPHANLKLTVDEYLLSW